MNEEIHKPKAKGKAKAKAKAKAKPKIKTTKEPVEAAIEEPVIIEEKQVEQGIEVIEEKPKSR